MIEKIAGLPLEEQATTINIYRDEDFADVWTSDRTMFTKLDRLCREAPDNYKCISVGRDRITHEILDKKYRIADKGLLSFSTRRRKLNLTEEQRAAARERLGRANSSR